MITTITHLGHLFSFISIAPWALYVDGVPSSSSPPPSSDLLPPSSAPLPPSSDPLPPAGGGALVTSDWGGMGLASNQVSVTTGAPPTTTTYSSMSAVQTNNGLSGASEGDTYGVGLGTDDGGTIYSYATDNKWVDESGYVVTPQTGDVAIEQTHIYSTGDTLWGPRDAQVSVIGDSGSTTYSSGTSATDNGAVQLSDGANPPVITYYTDTTMAGNQNLDMVSVTDGTGTTYYPNAQAAQNSLGTGTDSTYTDGTTTYRYSTYADGQQGWHDATGDVQVGSTWYDNLVAAY